MAAVTGVAENLARRERIVDYTILGRTGLEVSVMGVGGGGPSRLGQKTGSTEAESVTIIQRALDAGVNFIDTAEGYQTEGIVARAIQGLSRDSIVLSTKKSTPKDIQPEDVEKSLHASLKRLGTDHVDIYHLHGVMPDRYDDLHTRIVPTLLRLREQGKIRFLGVTEMFGQDSGHVMAQEALQHNVWDVMMVGFNILNQSARDRVFRQTIQKNIGILVMFAVRLALSRPPRLQELLQELLESGQLEASDIDLDDPLGFVVYEAGAVSVVDAAYRFSRDEPGTHVILSGTGSLDHLEANISSFARPPLPAHDVERLKRIFRRVDSVSGG